MVKSYKVNGSHMLHLHGCAPILATRASDLKVARGGTFYMMYRVLMVAGAVLALAACSSSPDWMSFGGHVRSNAGHRQLRVLARLPGAEAKTSNGQTCRTPCSLALPVETPLTVTFHLMATHLNLKSSKRFRQQVSPPFWTQSGRRRVTPASQQPRSTKKPAPKKSAQRNRPQRLPCADDRGAGQPASPWPTSAPPVRQ